MVSTGKPVACSTATSAAPGHLFDRLLDPLAECDQLIEVVPEDLHGQLGADAGEQLVESHLDGLQELVAIPGHGLDESLELGDDLDLGLRGSGHCSRARMMKVSATLGRHRVGRHLAGPDLREDPLHLGELLDLRLQARLEPDRLLERGSGNPQRVHRDVALVEIRDELGAEAHGQDSRAPRPTTTRRRSRSSASEAPHAAAGDRRTEPHRR